MARVRYMVSDAETAAAFYTEHFGFEIELQVPAIYIVTRGRPDALAQRPQILGAPPDARRTRA